MKRLIILIILILLIMAGFSIGIQPRNERRNRMPYYNPLPTNPPPGIKPKPLNPLSPEQMLNKPSIFSNILNSGGFNNLFGPGQSIFNPSATYGMPGSAGRGQKGRGGAAIMPQTSAWAPQTDRQTLAQILRYKSRLPQMTAGATTLPGFLGNIPPTGQLTQTEPEIDPVLGMLLRSTIGFIPKRKEPTPTPTPTPAPAQEMDLTSFHPPLSVTDESLAADAEQYAKSLLEPGTEVPKEPEVPLYWGWGGGWGSDWGSSGKKWLDWFKSMYWNV